MRSRHGAEQLRTWAKKQLSPSGRPGRGSNSKSQGRSGKRRSSGFVALSAVARSRNGPKNSPPPSTSPLTASRGKRSSRSRWRKAGGRRSRRFANGTSGASQRSCTRRCSKLPLVARKRTARATGRRSVDGRRPGGTGRGGPSWPASQRLRLAARAVTSGCPSPASSCATPAPAGSPGSGCPAAQGSTTARVRSPGRGRLSTTRGGSSRAASAGRRLRPRGRRRRRRAFPSPCPRLPPRGGGRGS